MSIRVVPNQTVSSATKVRATIFLPVNTNAERQAANEVAEAILVRFAGITRSLLRPAVFTGYWFDEAAGVIHPDAIALAFVDIALAADDHSLATRLGELAMFAGAVYHDVGSPQVAIYVTTQSIQTFLFT